MWPYPGTLLARFKSVAKRFLKENPNNPAPNPDSPTLNSHRHSHQWQPWKSSDLRRHQHRPHCAVSLPSALSLVASALASNSVSVISLSLSPRRLLVVYASASSFRRSPAIFLLWPPLPSLSFVFGQNENGNGRNRREGRCFSVCVAVAPHSSTLFLFSISLRNDSRSECFPLLILKKDDFVCSLSNGSCKLFELYGNETKMKLLAKELAPLQNIGSQNCITFSVDGSKFATGGSGKRDDALDLLNANYEVVKDRMNAGSKGIQEAAILDVLALGYVAVGHLKTVASLLNVAEKARRYIPREFKLAEAFGNTLGGFFLASYEDSPAGVFDEAQPVNVPTSFKQRAMLVDEIWHAAGDNASDIDWYAKRTILAGIYSTTEIYMLTDTSPAPPNIAGNHSDRGILSSVMYLLGTRL
ncbi:hypothetical protein Ahy_B08g091425 [Arachis hypogaea]|uniref:Ubiquinone biosynthesis protein n=1 Tax=Arachis hypogaea TaxID=3818 RepID=A0A444Y237_ARAHY|nr:hypothetical protein Ahy_B08g091425 [Arachis hypogaea]